MILSSRGKDVRELTFANITYFENNKRIITGFQETEHYRKSFFPNALLIDFFFLLSAFSLRIILQQEGVSFQ